MPTFDEQELMRDAVVVQYVSGQSGTKNTAFSLTIPEGYAMVIHDVDFGINTGSNPIANRIKMILSDDVDEITDPGYTAEQVIQSTELIFNLTASGRSQGFVWESKDCHKTMLVQNPNFICAVAVDPAANLGMYARIWFDFVKVSPAKILELLRQQQY